MRVTSVFVVRKQPPAVHDEKDPKCSQSLYPLSEREREKVVNTKCAEIGVRVVFIVCENKPVEDQLFTRNETRHVVRR